jgi:hypothetical protein
VDLATKFDCELCEYCKACVRIAEWFVKLGMSEHASASLRHRVHFAGGPHRSRFEKNWGSLIGWLAAPKLLGGVTNSGDVVRAAFEEITSRQSAQRLATPFIANPDYKGLE